MRTRSEIFQSIVNDYLTEDNIASTAYRIWEEEGRPNGEEFRNGVKIKEWNWLAATLTIELLAELDADFFHSVEPMNHNDQTLHEMTNDGYSDSSLQ